MPAALQMKEVMAMLNSRDIAKLRDDVEKNCCIFIELCKAQGLPVTVTSTVRDLEYQASLYEQGRTKPGSIVTNQKTPSFHWDRAALAFDICKNVKGHEYDDADFFKKCGAIGKKMGFSWGGDWKDFVDTPHFQWDQNGKYTASMVRAGKLPPSMPLYQQEVKDVTKDEAKEIIKAKAGLTDATIVYLDSYRYGDELIIKLGEALQ